MGRLSDSCQRAKREKKFLEPCLDDSKNFALNIAIVSHRIEPMSATLGVICQNDMVNQPNAEDAACILHRARHLAVGSTRTCPTLRMIMSEGDDRSTSENHRRHYLLNVGWA